MALLEVNDLVTQFYTEEGIVHAADGISYQIDRGEKLGIVGESGAGKSVSSLSIMGLIESPGRVLEGSSIKFRNLDTVQRLASTYPEHTVDLEALRAEFDPDDLFDNPDIDPSIDEYDFAPPGGEPPSRNRIDVVDVIDAGYGEALGLVDEDDFVFVEGDARENGYVELTRTSGPALRQIRGGEIAMVFQDAETALNPVYTVGEQISEAIRTHKDVSNAEAKEQAIEMLAEVGIPDPAERYSDYPHQFSGGMQQRAVIATALSCDPELLICDEPTTALDVTIEAQILELLDDLATNFDTAIQLITHDLAVVAEICDRVMVMYAGKVVEKAPIEELYYEPSHPYTAGLMGSIPRIGDTRDRLETIPGTMPDLVEVPPGCSFHPRCPYAEEVCTRKDPPLIDTDTRRVSDPADSDGHAAACLQYTGDLQQGLSYRVDVLTEGSHE